MKEEKFPHTKEASSLMETGGGREGSFGAMEESAGVQKAKQRDSFTQDWC